MAPDSEEQTMISLQIPAKTVEALKKRAKADGHSRSGLIRKLIEDGLNDGHQGEERTEPGPNCALSQFRSVCL